jgi:hypothetical protein
MFRPDACTLVLTVQVHYQTMSEWKRMVGTRCVVSFKLTLLSSKANYMQSE